MISGLLVLVSMVGASTLSVVYLMTREGLKTAKFSTGAIVTIVIPVGLFIVLLGITSLVAAVWPVQPTTYASSMGQMEPVRGIIHLSCHTGDPKGARQLDARALGLAFDQKEDRAHILVELNDVPPDRYSSTDLWLKDAGICQAYVR